MYVLGRHISELTSADIINLLRGQIQETKSLDYKKEIKLELDKDRKEFLNDITSMSNTNGGCFLYGIEEKKDSKGQNTGVPDNIVGISIPNYDKIIQQIEDLVKNNTEPSISRIAFNHLQIEDKHVFVIGISKGTGLPTMVTFNESNRFYRRRNSGKYLVGVYELNDMFLHNQSSKIKADEFRQARVKTVLSLQGAFPNLENSFPFFLQIIPSTFLDDKSIDLSRTKANGIITTMSPINCSGWDNTFNGDGLATYCNDYGTNSHKVLSYDQLFRNGIYESYTGRAIEKDVSTGKIIHRLWGHDFIKNVLRKLKGGFEVLKTYELETPFLIYMSLHNTRGTIVRDGTPYTSKQITIDDLYFPTILIENTEVDLQKILKPNFDILWQASGLAESPL